MLRNILLLIAVLLLSSCDKATTSAPSVDSDAVLAQLPTLFTATGFEPQPSESLYQADRHAAHPAQRLDLWTALMWLQKDSENPQLVTPTFAAQLQIIRFGLVAPSNAPQRSSEWANQALYVSRFVLFDMASSQRWQSEKISRAALGLAGADNQQVWVEHWQLTMPDEAEQRFSISIDTAELQLKLAGNDSPKQSNIFTLLPGFVQSPKGYQQQLSAAGELHIEQQHWRVRGRVWLDHLWGNNLPLGGGQLGLLQLRALLQPDSALHCLQLRRRDGSGVPIGGCSLLSSEGTQQFTRRQLDLLFDIDTARLQLSSDKLNLATDKLLNTAVSAEVSEPVQFSMQHSSFGSNPVVGPAWLDVIGLVPSKESE